ncbi:cation-transporting P-type ATPase [Streptomyces sp. NPDC127051]|uniref:cation-transporting P-type ATPase n=1 Tax=Streptomyces sp. NPDC127051 TaxID=3347119 RepID=UPI0036551742
MTETAAPDLAPDTAPDPLEPLPPLRRELHTGPLGLSSREAARRLAVYGPNEVRRTARASVPRELLRQLLHPLALLLWAAAALAFIATGDHTEHGGIAALSRCTRREPSPRWARRRHHRYS